MSGIAVVISDIIALSGDDSPIWLLAAGPVGGVATYWAFFRYYRNTDKSHAFERDTIIAAQPVQGGEEQVDRISKTRKSGVEGDNVGDYRKRVQRIR